VRAQCDPGWINHSGEEWRGGGDEEKEEDDGPLIAEEKAQTEAEEELEEELEASPLGSGGEEPRLRL
jgi:hypothetical protein